MAFEAIAKGRDRVLLVMATGTGKTYSAFQIIWRLWRAKRKKRILFLADRNILVDQTMVNDFRPFGPAMAKLSTKSKTIERSDGTEVDLPLAMDRRRRIDTAYEIYLGLYQAITGPEEAKKLYREFSPDFFDLIVVDECHRGSAAADSAWREILDHFSAATQVGLTATPKETEYASNSAYFGEPVYTYSLKQGIRDGFLAPYKVIKVHLDRDIEGYRPEQGATDRDGEEIEDRIYNTKDFDRVLVLDERTKLVARRVTEFLKESGDRFQKTIIFCVDEEHADRMRRALVNENQDLVAKNARYVMRITGSDQEGQAQLGNFIDPESRYPVLVTTSRLLSTGVSDLTRLKRQRILRWSILQHYEICATPLLDVTHSLRIAASFASVSRSRRAFIFVLGLPNLSGAITASAEAGLQVVHLLRADLPGTRGLLPSFPVWPSPPLGAISQMLQPNGTGHGVSLLPVRHSMLPEPDIFGGLSCSSSGRFT